MNYAIIGTGAIGGYYGGCLARVGQEVHFLFHSEYEAARKQGLRIDSTAGNFCIQPVRAYQDTADMPACDIVLVAIKTTSNHLLPALLKPILKPTSLVVLIQNGLGMEADLAASLPESVSIAGGMAFICSNRIAPAHIRHLDYGKLTLGLYRGEKRLVDALARDLQLAGVETAWIPDLNEARWRKLAWNIPYNGLSVILNTSTEALMNCTATRTLVEEVMNEVLRGALACGAGIPAAFVDEMMDMTDRMRPYKPSMRLDYDNRRPMEIDTIYTRPLTEARLHGAELPHIATLEQQLRFIQQNYLR